MVYCELCKRNHPEDISWEEAQQHNKKWNEYYENMKTRSDFKRFMKSVRDR